MGRSPSRLGSGHANGDHCRSRTTFNSARARTDTWQGERWLVDWRAVVCALAIQRDGGFNPATPFGQALAEARFAESRLERLLSASGDTLRALALRAARQVAAKGIACDWRTFAELLFTRDSDYRERINTRIARDFYRTLQAWQGFSSNFVDDGKK